MTKSDITDNQGLWFIKKIIARVHHVPIDIGAGNPTTIKSIWSGLKAALMVYEHATHMI
ncbi:hypothetical protein DPMN_015108 [Dreissena polymorpha]|uniref:Uncharacterized protein n=1 Tax=Dreissena polymorpha TaxID=45954 RepID=A0A9D4S5V6_DREPO|nr:hypothetical protein DPMN_015108 [Dreissena polymorpha]